jgi:signal peptidase I
VIRGSPSRILRVVFWSVLALVALTFAWTTRLGTRWPSVYFMTGASMEPTIAAERYFLAWNPPGELSRGDLVIFRYVEPAVASPALGEEQDSVFHVLRRLVAMGGDTVSMQRGAVIVNGTRQPWGFRIIERDAWRSALARGENLYNWGPWIVPRDSVMLLADTRDIIGWPDSRFIGFVAPSQIVARATRTVRGRYLR